MIENGKLVYDLKSVEEIRANVQREVSTLWEENLRLTNAQTFIISLSEKLLKVKNQLLNAYRKETPIIAKTHAVEIPKTFSKKKED